jgi:hypothetical protein
MNLGTGCVTSFIASHHAQPAIDGYGDVRAVTQR